MSTPPPSRLLDTNGKLLSPAAEVRSLSQLLEDERRTPLATAFSSRPQSRAGSGIAAGLAGAAAAAPLSALRASPPQPATVHPGTQQQVAQGLLAAKESEAALLRQQLQQLTADFKFNLKLLEERDAELEQVDSVVAGLREAATSREAALAEARRALSAKEVALREREARVASLEERQKQLVELCERQVADARAARDEEVARARQDAAAAQGDAARHKAEIIADYERQVTAAAAAERDARQRAAAAAEEAEHVRSQLSRAEARVAEQELAMQRMVSQFEGALATLQQLEAQYDGLAADAGAADRLRAARIEELEREAAVQRAARATLQQECDSLSASAAAAEAAAAEAKQQYHRAMMDAAELTEALAAARGEAAAAASRAGAAEEELAASRAAAQQAQAALEREVGCHARTQGLLEAARMQHEGARRDVQEQEALCAQLREAAAVLEAERNDCAKAAEAAEAKLQAVEERATLLAAQVEQEGRLREQQLAAREAELAARWERALEAAQGERATLQQALDLANRQLQAAHRDMETLRLQFQHLRLGGGPPANGLGAAAPEAAGARLGALGGAARVGVPGRAEFAGTSSSSGRSHHQVLAAGAGGQALHAGAGPGSCAGDGHDDALSGHGTASPAHSRDVFSEVPDLFPSSSFQQHQQQPQHSGGPASSAYQQQLYRHIDTLASKLSSFQQAVEHARQAGQQASRQLAESSTMLPADLQRRQEVVSAAADQQLQQALAAERQQFEEERRQLDRQLAEQQAALVEREEELRRLRRAEEERKRQEEAEQQRRQQEEQRRRQEEREQQRQLEEQRHRQEAQQWQPQQQHWAHQGEVLPGATATFHSGAPPPALRASWAQQPQQASWAQQPQQTSRLPPRQLGGGGASPDAGLAALRLSTSASSAAYSEQPQAQQQQQQGRSVSEALATVGSSPPMVAAGAAVPAPAGSYASSRHASPAAGMSQLAPPRANGSLAQDPGLAGAATGAAAAMPGANSSSRTAPLRAAAGTLSSGGVLAPLPVTQQAQQLGPAPGGSGEDPLARARRQVLAAKSYLRQVAEMGSRLAQDGGA